MKYPNDQDNYLDLSDEDWYAFNENYGTSEEKKLVKHIKGVYERIKNNYEEIYLLRNASHFKLFRFSDARVVEPDFVFFLKEKGETTQVIYQLFIEPKGGHLIDKDQWKEDFFAEIEAEFGISPVVENNEVRIFGLPFFNKELRRIEFSEKLKSIIGE